MLAALTQVIGQASTAFASGDSVSGGLGLRIAQSFAEANGGSLGLLDRPGGGTIARLDLKAASELPEAPG